MFVPWEEIISAKPFILNSAIITVLKCSYTFNIWRAQTVAGDF